MVGETLITVTKWNAAATIAVRSIHKSIHYLQLLDLCGEFWRIVTHVVDATCLWATTDYNLQRLPFLHRADMYRSNNHSHLHSHLEKIVLTVGGNCSIWREPDRKRTCKHNAANPLMQSGGPAHRLLDKHKYHFYDVSVHYPRTAVLSVYSCNMLMEAQTLKKSNQNSSSVNTFVRPTTK